MFESAFFVCKHIYLISTCAPAAIDPAATPADVNPTVAKTAGAATTETVPTAAPAASFIVVPLYLFQNVSKTNVGQFTIYYLYQHKSMEIILKKYRMYGKVCLRMLR